MAQVKMQYHLKLESVAVFDVPDRKDIFKLTHLYWKLFVNNKEK